MRERRTYLEKLLVTDAAIEYLLHKYLLVGVFELQ